MIPIITKFEIRLFELREALWQELENKCDCYYFVKSETFISTKEIAVFILFKLIALS